MITVYRSLIFLTAFFCLELDAQTDVLPTNVLQFEHEGEEIKGLFFTTLSTAQVHEDISRLVIVVHGTLRNGDEYFDHMLDALSMRPELSDSIAVIAPQFITEEDVDFHGLNASYPYWSSSGWASGSTSRNSDPDEIRISSFELLDTLIARSLKWFPSLKYLTFTGHSAGAQLANAYTASSPIFSLLCTDYGISSRTIIANPGRYVYMTPRRRTAGTLDQFMDGYANCADYNEWSYGLEDLFVYPDRSGRDQIRQWVGSREITYLLGDQDTDPDDTLSSCRAKAQGEHRFERGLIYFNHIIDTYGSGVRDLHSLVTVPDVGHDHLDMFTSPKGLVELFDVLPKSDCAPVTTTVTETNESNTILYPNPTSNHVMFNHPVPEWIDLYDGSGNKVLSTRPGKSLDLSSLTAGVYSARMHTGQSVVWRKVIKL